MRPRACVMTAIAVLVLCGPACAQAQVRAKADVSCRPGVEKLHYDCIFKLANSRTGEPLSGLTLSALILSALLMQLMGVRGAAGVAAVLGVAAVVAVAVSVSGSLIQDLKAGHLLGGTPWKMEIVEIVSPEDGEVLGEQQPGEIVLTPLGFRGGGVPRPPGGARR